MKKILSVTIFIFLTSCGGYNPIYSSKDLNFNIYKINNINNDRITQNIKKNLKPYLQNFRKGSLTLDITSSKDIIIVAKNKKGDPSVFEMTIKSKVVVSSNTLDEEFNFVEKFNLNNQSNKFEFEQYKKNIENDLSNKIYEELLLKLKSLK